MKSTKFGLLKLLMKQNAVFMLVVLTTMSVSAGDLPYPANEKSIPGPIMQSFTISGIVTGAEGLPLPGVNISVPGTLVGTVTDFNGIYEIEVPPGYTELEFSYIGYLKQTVEFGNNTEVNVTLLEDIMGLEEVVVVGYGTVKKEDLTGAVAVIDADEIQSMNVDNVSQALSGKTPGVTVTSNSGSPGKLPTIRIRGVGSINNAEPLYVVDGVPVDPSAIAYLNTNDIQSMSVLKDASALAIYGARAANGIIEITTKSGTKGEMKVSYSMYYGNQTITKHPSMMDGFQFAETFNTVNEYIETDDEYIAADQISNVNWFNEMSQAAPMQNHHLNITGGDKVIYNFSVGAFDQTGIIKNTYLKRYNTRLSTTSQVKEWLKVGQTVTLTFSDYKGSVENWEWGSGAYYQSIMAQRVIEPYNEEGIWNLNPYSDALENPMISIDRNFRVDNDYQLNGNAFVEISPIKGLTFKSLVGYNLGINDANSFTPTYSIDPSNQLLYPSLMNHYGRGSSYTFDNYLTYENQIGDHGFKILLGTSAWESKNYWFEGTHTRALPNESERYRYFDAINQAQLPYELTVENNTDSTLATTNLISYTSLNGGAPSIDRTAGLLGRVEYNFKNRYLLTANFRRDGSTRFGPGKQFGVFPGFAAAWKIHQEPFLENVGAISQLKVRAGWGKIGNDRIGRYEFLDLMNTNMGYSHGDIFTPGASASKPSNPYLHWEASVTTNLGLDLGLFNGKLFIVADAYNKLTDGMLFNPPAISISGVISPAASNVSSMVNRGLELSASYRHREGDFHYEFNGHISLNRMKVISISDDVDFIDAGSYANRRIADWSRTTEGYPIGMFYGLVTDGIFQSEEEIAAAPIHNNNTVPGDRRYKDLNGDNVIDDRDKTIIGNPHPDFSYGFSTNLSYKGIELTAVFTGMYGHDIFVAYKAHTHDFRNPGFNYHTDLLDAWTPENTDTDQFAYNSRTNDLNMEESDWYIEDGSFLRLQTLRLAYSLPESVMKAIKFDRVKVYVSAQNLLTLTKYEYGDPDIGTLSVFQGTHQRTGYSNSLIFSSDQIRLPTPRVLSFGVDVTF